MLYGTFSARLNIRSFFDTMIDSLSRKSVSVWKNGYGNCSFGNIRLTFGTILENRRKSLESGWKSSENHQRRRH